MQENLHCIDVAADFEDRHAHGNAGKGTWVAIKLVSLLETTDHVIHGAEPFRCSVWAERAGARRGVVAETVEVSRGQPSTVQPLHPLSWLPVPV